MKNLVFTIALLTWAAVAAPPLDMKAAVHQAVEVPGSHARHVEALLARVREQHKLPALGAVVLRTETTLDLTVTGVRQQGKPEAVAPDDRFHLGSMGKAITATVIARLVEEGRLAWTTRPVDVFPELARSIHPGYREVTLEQLLRHQGGTPRYGSPGAMKGAKSRAGSGSPRDQRRAFSVWLLQQRPHVAPGTRTEYSNAGYAVGAAMAEAAAGEAWEALVESKLAQPLGIGLTHGWPANGDSLQPWGHKAKSALFGMAASQTTVEPQAPGDHAIGAIFGPAGDYSLSLADYAKFLQLHLAGLAGRDGLLEASSVRRLHSGPGEWALGWVLGEFEGTPAHRFGGRTEMFVSRVTILPERGVAIAVVTNAGNASAESGTREAMTELLRIYGQPAAQ